MPWRRDLAWASLTRTSRERAPFRIGSGRAPFQRKRRRLYKGPGGSARQGRFRVGDQFRVGHPAGFERDGPVGVDRIVECDLHGEPLDVLRTAGQGAVRAFDTDRDDGRARLVGDLGEPGGEAEEAAVPGTPAFREDGEVVPLAQALGPALEAFGRAAFSFERIGVEEELDPADDRPGQGVYS